MKIATIIFIFFLALSVRSATYYIDSTNGADSNNGLGPDASAGTNKPWKTIAKYMRTNGVSGDTAYLAPGVYRESVTVNITSPTATTKLLGDPQNVQGFKNSSGVLVPPAFVRWTVITNETTTSPGTSALSLNGSDYWWFENIYFTGAGAGGVLINASTATSTNIVLTNCIAAFSGPVAPFNITAGFGVPLNLRVSNCKLTCLNSTTITITHTSGTGSDWNLNAVIENTELAGANLLTISKSGSLANVGGGVMVTNCTLYSFAGSCITCTSSSTNNFTNYVVNCLILVGNNGINAGDVSQVYEDYNVINASSARLNTNTGTHSKTFISPLLDFDASRMFGFGPRPFFSPMTGSPLIGLGTTAETVDLFNKPRPSPNSIGSYELYQNVETSHSFSQ